MRARDTFVHRWKADRQVGHPVILARPAQMIGRAFYSATASTDDMYVLYVFIVKAFNIFIAIGMLRAFHGI